MLSNTSLDFLKRLLETSGPSGFEAPCAAVYREYAATFAHSVKTDVMGNTIAAINKVFVIFIFSAAFQIERQGGCAVKSQPALIPFGFILIRRHG